MTPRRTKLLVALGAVLVAGCLAEAAFQALGVLPLERSPLRGYHQGHDTYGWLGTPDHVARFDGPEFDLVIANGPDGFRRSEVPFEGPADAPTTVFLGDSFTWGWAVEQGEVYTDVLQAAFQGERRIVNRGVNAWGTAQQRLLLERVLIEDRPDTVVIAFFGNDPTECVDDRGGKRPYFELVDGALERRNVPVRKALTGPFRELSKRSVVLSHLRSGVNELTRGIRDDPTDWLGEVVAQETPYGWEVCRALLVDVRDACAAAGVRFELVFIPVPAEVAAPPESLRANRRLRELVAELCAAEAIPWLDLTPGLRAAWSVHAARTELGLPYYFPLDQHWTAAGHAEVALLIEAWWRG